MKREKNCQNCDTEKNTKLRMINFEMKYYCNMCYSKIVKKLQNAHRAQNR